MARRGTGQIKWLEVALSLDTDAYASGDVLAATQEETNFWDVVNQTAEIISVNVVDEDDQKGAFDVVFLRTNVALGTENAAATISDANMSEVVGQVEVLATDYKDYGGASYAQPVFNPFVIASDLNATKSLFIGAISRDAKTYTAAGLTLQIGYLNGQW